MERNETGFIVTIIGLMVVLLSVSFSALWFKSEFEKSDVLLKKFQHICEVIEIENTQKCIDKLEKRLYNQCGENTKEIEKCQNEK